MVGRDVGSSPCLPLTVLYLAVHWAGYHDTAPPSLPSPAPHVDDMYHVMHGIHTTLPVWPRTHHPIYHCFPARTRQSGFLLTRNKNLKMLRENNRKYSRAKTRHKIWSDLSLKFLRISSSMNCISLGSRCERYLRTDNNANLPCLYINTPAV